MLDLCATCDAMVSLHRSEGFGRSIAEAMLLGTPVVATAWSGNLDFCQQDSCALVPATFLPLEPADYPFGQGFTWAEPDLMVAAQLMRRLRHDPDYRTSLASVARRRMREAGNPDTVGGRYRDRLRRLYDG